MTQSEGTEITELQMYERDCQDLACSDNDFHRLFFPFFFVVFVFTVPKMVKYFCHWSISAYMKVLTIMIPNVCLQIARLAPFTLDCHIPPFSCVMRSWPHQVSSASPTKLIQQTLRFLRVL